MIILRRVNRNQQSPITVEIDVQKGEHTTSPADAEAAFLNIIVGLVNPSSERRNRSTHLGEQRVAHHGYYEFQRI